jgi:MoaA/NifB/PqqE/SkfB family radical SAM enzyme
MKDILSKIVTKKDIQKARKNNILISLALRLPCNCNLHCGFCYGKIPAKGILLDFNEIKKILDQASKFKARTVEIVGEGEPLLYPQFIELISYINHLGMVPTLYSNCTLITQDIARFLFENNTTVIGKQNTLSPKKQDNICGIKGAYQKITNGLNNLIEAGFNDTNPSRLGIHTVVLKENISDIPKLWIQWRKKRILPQVQALVYPSKTQARQYFEYYKKYATTPAETRHLFEKLSKIDREKFKIIWDPKFSYPIAPDGCRVIYGTIGITQVGDVQICSYTEKPLGNIKEKSLKDILQSDEVKKIRIIDKILGYPEKGYGCRANAFNMTGDLFAPDPYYNNFLAKIGGKKV